MGYHGAKTVTNDTIKEKPDTVTFVWLLKEFPESVYSSKNNFLMLCFMAHFINIDGFNTSYSLYNFYS